jgi:hypothetical protein
MREEKQVFFKLIGVGAQPLSVSYRGLISTFALVVKIFREGSSVIGTRG